MVENKYSRLIKGLLVLLAICWQVQSVAPAIFVEANMSQVAMVNERVHVPFIFCNVPCSPLHLNSTTPSVDCDINVYGGRCRLQEFSFDDYPSSEIRALKQTYAVFGDCKICAFVFEARPDDNGTYALCKITDDYCNNWHKNTLIVVPEGTDSSKCGVMCERTTEQGRGGATVSSFDMQTTTDSADSKERKDKLQYEKVGSTPSSVSSVAGGISNVILALASIVLLRG